MTHLQFMDCQCKGVSLEEDVGDVRAEHEPERSSLRLEIPTIQGKAVVLHVHAAGWRCALHFKAYLRGRGDSSSGRRPDPASNDMEQAAKAARTKQASELA